MTNGSESDLFWRVFMREEVFQFDVISVWGIKDGLGVKDELSTNKCQTQGITLKHA